MGLSIYTHDQDSTNVSETHKAKSCSFKIGLSPKSYNGAIKQLPEIQGQRIIEIKGIADDAIELGYATEWGESPGAKAVASIKEFTRAEAFKMFSGTVFNSNVATDKWTQIVPKDSSSLSVAIKFRAYYKANFLNTNSYMTIIPWLTFLTSPMMEFSMINEVDNIVGALKNAKQAGEELGQELNGVAESNGQLTDKAITILKKIDETLTKLSTNSRGTATFTLDFGDLIQAADDVDWIIKDWSFTPSVPCGQENNPLWVDFQINMETNEKLSYTKLEKIFKKLKQLNKL